MVDLNIYQAYNLENLSFLKSFKECRMLFVSKAHLKDINEVVGSEPYFMARPRCLALYDCIVDDVSYLKDSGLWDGRELEWRFVKKYASSGVIGDLGVHLIDLAELLAGKITGLFAIKETVVTQRKNQKNGKKLI
jgi:hypothetical protein